MKNLTVITQGIKGGETKVIATIGNILATIEERQRIFIDNFEGRGDSYKQRKTPLVQIIEDGKNLFSGTFERLKINLNNATNIEVTKETFYKLFENETPTSFEKKETYEVTHFYNNETNQRGQKIWNFVSSQTHQYYLTDINV